jgi:hypothetical protein
MAAFVFTKMKLPIPDGLSALIQPLRVPLWLRLRRAVNFAVERIASAALLFPVRSAYLSAAHN